MNSCLTKSCQKQIPWLRSFMHALARVIKSFALAYIRLYHCGISFDIVRPNNIASGACEKSVSHIWSYEKYSEIFWNILFVEWCTKLLHDGWRTITEHMEAIKQRQTYEITKYHVIAQQGACSRKTTDQAWGYCNIISQIFCSWFDFCFSIFHRSSCVFFHQY